MIQIYEASNTGFDKNGDMVLFPTSCIVKAALNGSWYLEMAHPVDDEGRWQFIGEEAVLKVPTWQEKEQLYRIATVQKTDTEVSVTAYPIFYDAAGEVFLLDVRPTGCNGQQALDRMLLGYDHKYTASSDIETRGTAYFVKRNFLDGLNGQTSPTFIERWGGEILFDNYHLTVNRRVGSDHGVQVCYGKNIQGIQYSVDLNDLVTRIVPQGHNGRMISAEPKWVDSPLVSSYAKVYTRNISFEEVRLSSDMGEGEEEEGITVCQTQQELDTVLREKCQAEFSAGIDKPKVTLEISMVPLQDMEEYRDVQMLENISLGDTVHCRHSKLGITSQARVVEIEWDCVADRLRNVLLGDFAYNYFSELQSTVSRVSGLVRSDGTIPAEKVKGALNASLASLYAQYDLAKRMDVLAILFENLDPSSSSYGALGIGTQGLMISRQRNAEGTGWVWTSAVTAEGVHANTVTVGIISDREGKNYWNMETGEIRIAPTAKVGTSDSAGSLGDYIDGRQHEYTSEEIFNLLTQNGELDCLYMGEDGRMYVSFTYAQGGTLKLGGNRNQNGWLVILDASGNEIGSIDNTGAHIKGTFRNETDNDWGTEWIEMLDAVVRSGVGEDTHSFIDMEAQYPDGITMVLQNPYRGIALKAKDVFFETTQAGNTRVFLKGDVEFKDNVFFSGEVNLLEVPFVTGAPVMAGKDGKLGIGGSSSAHISSYSNLTSASISGAYGIQPINGLYKSGHLPEGDDLSGRSVPMLLAEDVERYVPTAAVHDSSGATIDWNPRVLIPVMFQMLKSQKTEIDTLKELVNTGGSGDTPGQAEDTPGQAED